MSNYAYVTLVTRASYLAGVVILAHSLRRQGSRYPLIVCYTTTLPKDCLKALQLEADQSNLLLRAVDALEPPSFSSQDLIAERFGDTWTKLRVFEPWVPQGYSEFERLCYLDADMMLRHNLDFVFDTKLPNRDWAAASQCCVCNLDNDVWAPSAWKASNCAHTMSTPNSLPVAVPNSKDVNTTLTAAQKETYSYFNSGLFLFQPSPTLWKALYDMFASASPEKIKSYKLPDQDFLNEFFRNRWMSIGWRVNALKTLRYCHPNMWRDDVAVNVHYIVDKPWAGARPRWVRTTNDQDRACDGDGNRNGDGHWSATGFKGRDGETHSWWWENWDEWQKSREAEGQTKVVDIVRDYMYGGTWAESSDMQAIGVKVQSFANNGKRVDGSQVHEKDVHNANGSSLVSRAVPLEEYEGTEQLRTRQVSAH